MKRYFIRVICSLTLVALPAMHAQAEPARNPIVFDSNDIVRSFYGVPISLTHSGLKRLPFRVTFRDELGGEGGPYRVYVIRAQKGVLVEVTFDEDGKLYNAWTESLHAIGPKGVRVGSTLAEVKAAWPDGDSLFFFEDGYVATYRTRSNVSFMFDPDDLPAGTFDHGRPWDFPIPDNIQVKTIAIFAKPAPPRAKATPPIDQNKTSTTVTSATDKKLISRLDVERIPGSELIRLGWTHKGKTDADRVIDVSGYPEFDIWTRDLIWHPSLIIISFRYGRFKDCAVREDDRDKVYVTFRDNGATLSPTPPAGAKVDDRFALPKSVGTSMKSAAHGCRRTYDPKSGTFGLEKVE